jgi:hypothetical protein
MRSRCTNPKNHRFEHYGGRGIEICSEWDDFAAFQRWALASGYDDKLTLERRDVNGGYNPENCTWAGPDVQAANRRMTYKAPDGELWSHKALRAGIKLGAFRQRVSAGWPLDRAASQPMNQRRKPHTRDSGGRFA